MVQKTSLIELANVNVSVQGTQILDEVNWQVSSGESWVLLGPNGAGKTTLVSLIEGRRAADSGTVNVLGKPVGEHDSTVLAARIGQSGQAVRSRFSSADTVLQVVLASAWGQSVHFDETYEQPDVDRARDLLAVFRLDHLADRPFGFLSEGERQMVSLARSLMSDPEILILDEPTAGLDMGYRELLVNALEEVITGRRAPATIMITHEIEDIAPSFSHAALLGGGRITAAGPIENVLTGENLSTLFGLPLSVTREQGRWWARAN